MTGVYGSILLVRKTRGELVRLKRWKYFVPVGEVAVFARRSRKVRVFEVHFECRSFYSYSYSYSYIPNLCITTILPPSAANVIHRTEVISCINEKLTNSSEQLLVQRLLDRQVRYFGVFITLTMRVAGTYSVMGTLPRLHTLDLSYNEISSVDPLTFSYLGTPQSKFLQSSWQ